jgi:triphosphoribosyl-dephospho-CoA synthase
MDRGQTSQPLASPEQVSSAATTALTLTYSAPMPGCDSRYADRAVAHETRLLSIPLLSAVLGYAAEQPVGESVLDATVAARRLTGSADPCSVGYLAPLARSALRGERLELTLARLTHRDARAFARALEVSGSRGPLLGAIEVTLGAGREATLRDAMRFAAGRDALAREYARNFEVTRQLAYPALLNAVTRAEASRSALVQTYLEVLSEVPDLEVASRAGIKEAEEVSRMARGVLKAGGVHSRRGVQQVSNLDGLLRSDSRLYPSATEAVVLAAAFLMAVENGAEFLNYRVRPTVR